MIAKPTHCPRCGVANPSDPAAHEPDCAVARILRRQLGTTPRDEWDYLDGNPWPFEPADLIEKGLIA